MKSLCLGSCGYRCDLHPGVFLHCGIVLVFRPLEYGSELCPYSCSGTGVLPDNEDVIYSQPLEKLLE